MNFFRTARPTSAEDEVALARLSALASRIKAPRAAGPEAEPPAAACEPAEPPSEPLPVRDLLQ